MGITISGPSTQIPTNVVEVGNEITQNQLNAITASNTPSVGNPFQTTTALWAFANASIYPSINNKVLLPATSWSHPFPMTGNFVLVYRADSNLWFPWNSASTLIHTDSSGGPVSNSYNFDFTDGNGNFVFLNGSADVGVLATNYYTLGYWDNTNLTTYTTSSGTNYYSGTGPNYASNWDNPIANAYFYDSNDMNWKYRYVYLDGSGNFYTADNQFNPPF